VFESEEVRRIFGPKRERMKKVLMRSSILFNLHNILG
jgi:hypothetical protein